MSARRRAPRTPKRLRTAGSILWKDIHAALPTEAELNERELALLAAACRQADDIASLDEYLAATGVVVPGSMGQTRLNPAISELRQARLALARLLGELDLSESEAPAGTASSRRARQAANSRWDRRDRLVDLRRGGSAA